MNPKISFDLFLNSYKKNPKKWSLSYNSVYFFFNDESFQEYDFYFLDSIKYKRFYRKNLKRGQQEVQEKAMNKLLEELKNDT